MIVNEFRTRAVQCERLRTQNGLRRGHQRLHRVVSLKGLRPSRAEGIAGFRPLAGRVSHLSLRKMFGSCKTALKSRPDGWVIPLPAAALPLATPGLADGQGCSATRRWHPKGGGELCPHRNSSTSTARGASGELLERRRERPAAARVERPALFELNEDRRPGTWLRPA